MLADDRNCFWKVAGEGSSQCDNFLAGITPNASTSNSMKWRFTPRKKALLVPAKFIEKKRFTDCTLTILCCWDTLLRQLSQQSSGPPAPRFSRTSDDGKGRSFKDLLDDSISQTGLLTSGTARRTYFSRSAPTTAMCTYFGAAHLRPETDTMAFSMGGNNGNNKTRDGQETVSIARFGATSLPKPELPATSRMPKQEPGKRKRQRRKGLRAIAIGYPTVSAFMTGGPSLPL
jgi:hypothetical protein